MEMTKRCSKCKGVKEKSEFWGNRSKKEGLAGECKVCASVRKKEHYEKNREAILENKKEYRHKNRGAILEYKKEYYEKNREAILEYKKEYYQKNLGEIKEYKKKYKQKNPEKINMYSAKRRAIKRNACPDWLTQEHHSAIAEFYNKAQELTKETGIPHHVDHIVPLKGKSYDLGTKRMRHTVSGLHVPWNLRVVSAEDNLIKSCKYSEWK